MTSKEALQHIVRHGYAWPGGYPLFATTRDSATLCRTCCTDNYRIIREEQRDDTDCGWHVECTDINWEDETLQCDNCNNPIESAYGESN